MVNVLVALRGLRIVVGITCLYSTAFNFSFAGGSGKSDGAYVASSFEDRSLGPFVLCTTQKPNYAKVTHEDFVKSGSYALKFQWHQNSWNGTRMTMGAEACSSIKLQKEGWFGFSLYLPDPGYPRDKEAVVMQIFQVGRCNSWAATLEVINNDLYISHRGSCGRATKKLIKNSLPSNTWFRVAINFVASNRRSGHIKLWYGEATESAPTYFANNINFGFGVWGSNDYLVDENPLILKFGQYNYDNANFVVNEVRTSYYDNVIQVVGNPKDSWFLMKSGRR